LPDGPEKGRALSKTGIENSLSANDTPNFGFTSGQRKKLLVEGRAVCLLTNSVDDSSAIVIPEGLHHVFICCLAQRAAGSHRVYHYREIPLLVRRGLIADKDDGLCRCSGIRIALGVEPDVGNPVIRDGRFG